MKRIAALALVMLIVVGSVGCFGPRNLTRGVDDWANQMYVETPWLIGNSISAGILWFVLGFTEWIDSIIDIYYFWVKDAQPFGSGNGTPYTHKNPVAPKTR